jgi:hypothetical protein
VSNKEDLLDAMIDALFSEIELPAGEHWKTTMRRAARVLALRCGPRRVSSEAQPIVGP